MQYLRWFKVMTGKIPPVIKFEAHLILGRKRGKLKIVARKKKTN